MPGPIWKLSGREFSGSLPKRRDAVWARGFPHSQWLGKSGRACLGGCVYAPAGGRQARPDLIEIKSGKRPGHGKIRFHQGSSRSDGGRPRRVGETHHRRVVVRGRRWGGTNTTLVIPRHSLKTVPQHLVGASLCQPILLAQKRHRDARVGASSRL